jgi:hypothetical protein
LGGHIRESDYLAAMLPRKGIRLRLPAEREQARRTPVKVCFDWLFIQTGSHGMV